MVDASVVSASNGDLRASTRHAGLQSGDPVGSALDAYCTFADTAIVAPPQTSAWTRHWKEQAAADLVIATLADQAGPAMSVVLEIVRDGPFRIARYPGGQHANGNFPVIRSDFRTAGDEHLRLVAAIRAQRPDIDLLALERQARELCGRPNPLLALPHSDSPNVSLAVDLSGGFDAMLERHSGKRKRKKHRSQTRKFGAAGAHRRIEARTRPEAERLLEAFFAMKASRFRSMGIGDVFAPAEVRSFFRALFVSALDEASPTFRLHGLEVGGVLRAVTGSSTCGDRLICEFGAIRDDDLAAVSPGDFLFFENIDEACREGFATYDFSVGDEFYKRLWCDIETRQFDSFVPLTAKGHLLASGKRVAASTKRWIKSNHALWSIIKRLRRRAAEPSGGADRD